MESYSKRVRDFVLNIPIGIEFTITDVWKAGLRDGTPSGVLSRLVAKGILSVYKNNRINYYKRIPK